MAEENKQEVVSNIKNDSDRNTTDPVVDLAVKTISSLVLKIIVAPPMIYAGWHLTRQDAGLLPLIGWIIICYTVIPILFEFLNDEPINSVTIIVLNLIIGISLMIFGHGEIFWGGVCYASIGGVFVLFKLMVG